MFYLFISYFLFSYVYIFYSFNSSWCLIALKSIKVDVDVEVKGIIIIRICTVKPALRLLRLNKILSVSLASLNLAISVCNFHVCRKIEQGRVSFVCDMQQTWGDQTAWLSNVKLYQSCISAHFTNNCCMSIFFPI